MVSVQDVRQIEVCESSGTLDVDSTVTGLCPREVAHLMDFGLATVIDVREPKDFSDRWIAGAVHVPESELPSSDLVAGEAARLVFCCDTGDRSRRIATQMLMRGRCAVEYLAGGLDAWAAEGLGLVRSAR